MVNRGDSFHDCWANIGAPIHMKDSIQSGIAPGATGSGHIRAASRRVEAMGASLGNPVQPPTVFELDEALGERVQTCELLGKNWRNRVYPVQLATDDAALAKQVVMGQWVLDSQIRRAKTGSSRDESSHGPTDQQ